MVTSIRAGLLLVLVVLFVVPAAGPAAPPQPDSIDRDYSQELPRIKPTEPQDALAKFTLKPGFRIEQTVAEPLVVDPVAMAWDEDSRLFVVEMRGYSEDGDQNLGRVRLLEDTDSDGRFDRSTVFAEGLSWPTAITYARGGVFVGAAPDIWFLKDTDGDGKADERRVVFTGFGRGNVQGLLNTFKWGLDNRIHGATSSSGAKVVRLGDDGQPIGEEADALVLRGRDFAFDAKTLAMTAESGGAQHGLSFNQWGEKFVCSNSDHVQQVLFEDRYIARNPYLAAPGARVSIAADGPQADVFRTSPIEPWRIVRTRLRVQGIVPGPVEGGGTPAGYFTGSTGVTIFRGTAWPAEYQGWAIVGDVGSNLVHRKRLEPAGVRYVARRVDEKSEFLSSSDIWFRPVQFANAPDGALYIADMYRETIEHPASLPPIIKKHLDLTSGRDRGRIYRVVGDGFQQPRLPKLSQATTAELVALLAHPNGWHRETAARLLYERQDAAAIKPLEQLVAEADAPEGRIHALYALDGLNASTPDVLLAALADSHPRVREHAVRLSEKLAGDSPRLRTQLLAMTDDDALRVRYQTAFSLGELSGKQRNAALASIWKREASDPHVTLAVRSSLAEGAGDVLAIFAADEAFRQTADGLAAIRALASQIGKQQRADDIAALLQIVRQLSGQQPTVLQAIVSALAAKPGSALEQQIAAASGGQAAELMRELLTKARADAVDTARSLEQRVSAVQLLRLGKLAGQEATFAELLAPSEPADIQAAALDTLASFDSPEVADTIIGVWRTLSPRLRTRAGDVLFSRESWLRSLLDAVQSKQIAVADLDPARLKVLAAHRDPAVREQAARLVSQSNPRGRQEIVVAYQGVLGQAGDVARGRQVFQKTCAACHRLEGKGHEIGPNLAAMKARGDEAILVNVLDPNREVNPQYLSYVLVTGDGRSLTGLIAAETATSVTLRRADNASDTVLRVDIDELLSTGLSLMPEGLEKQIDQQAMKDLLAYLRAVE